MTSTRAVQLLQTANMNRRSTPPSGIGRALHKLRESVGADNTTEAEGKGRLSPHGHRHRAASEARTYAPLDFGDAGAAKRLLGGDTGSIEAPRRTSTVSNFNKDLRDFCTGQPPKQSFLSAEGRSPPRFRMARRSTLADKPELDGLLKAVMVTYKGKEYLPLNKNTIHHLSQWLNGAKPLAHHCIFRRLMITSEANKVSAESFVAALEHIGMYCEHMAIIAPFHTTEFGNVFAREVDNLESGSDWEKILLCFPNLDTLIFEHPTDEPTNLTRDTFYALNCALENDTTVQKIKNVLLDVPPKVMFNFHHDFHTRQRQRYDASPHTFSKTSSPLTMVGSETVYADGVQDFAFLDDLPVLGPVDPLEDFNG